MANTYTGKPATSTRDFVRWRTGDTDASDWLQTDSEIDAALSIHGDKFQAAAAVADAIAAKFARRVDSTMGKLKLTLSQKVKQYRELAGAIRTEATISVAAAPWMAAHSVSAKDGYEEDTDRVVPAFAVDMHDTVEQNSLGLGRPTTGI
jgi:hypothetical protein